MASPKATDWKATEKDVTASPGSAPWIDSGESRRSLDFSVGYSHGMPVPACVTAFTYTGLFHRINQCHHQGVPREGGWGQVMPWQPLHPHLLVKMI